MDQAALQWVRTNHFAQKNLNRRNNTGRSFLIRELPSIVNTTIFGKIGFNEIFTSHIVQNGIELSSTLTFHPMNKKNTVIQDLVNKEWEINSQVTRTGENLPCEKLWSSGMMRLYTFWFQRTSDKSNSTNEKKNSIPGCAILVRSVRVEWLPKAVLVAWKWGICCV